MSFLHKIMCLFGRHYYNECDLEFTTTGEDEDWWYAIAENNCVFCGKKRRDEIQISKATLNKAKKRSIKIDRTNL